MRTLIAPIAALVLLAACSGGDSSDGGTSPARDMSTPAAIADTLGCSASYHDDTTEELYVKEVGTCDFDGETVRLLTFGDGKALTAFVEVATTFGGTYVLGDTWTVKTDDTATAEKVSDQLGGKVQ